jgi:tRNA A-37 threonylcarbamoyl transferase component Bud32
VTEEVGGLIAGRYRLEAEVGSGAMGVVWRARDQLLGRTVAVKALAVRAAADDADNDAAARRAMREGRIAARLHHPNVIAVFDAVQHEGRPFLIMEYLESRSLSTLLAEGETLSPREAARIGAQVAAALAAAHRAEIVHRDVKPGNVLLAEDGTVKLADFGISRATGDTSVTASGVLLGTLAYIAPEVGRGEPADARSDVHSLGATLYAATEGRPPFGTDDNPIALLYRIVHEDMFPVRNAGPLEPVLMWMLERDPDQRPTMAQVQRALEAVEAKEADGATAEVPEADGADAAAGTGAAAAAASKPKPKAVPKSAAKAAPAVKDTKAPEVPEAAAVAPTATSPASPNAKKRGALLAGAIALVAAAVVALVLTQHSNGGSTAADIGAPGKHSASPTVTPSPAAHTASASASPKTSTSAKATAPSSPPASTPGNVVNTSGSQSVTTQLANTITDYYKLVPGNLDEAWTWMTADYQTNHAQGRSGYNTFWSRISSVTVTDVQASAPSTVVATIHYVYKDGTRPTERTEFGLVYQQNRWLIASSSVLD